MRYRTNFYAVPLKGPTIYWTCIVYRTCQLGYDIYLVAILKCNQFLEIYTLHQKTIGAKSDIAKRPI